MIIKGEKRETVNCFVMPYSFGYNRNLHYLCNGDFSFYPADITTMRSNIIDLLKTVHTDYPAYNDGVYTGVADAHNGDITAEVTIYDGRILYVEVVVQKETAPYLEEVFKSIPFNILKNQTTADIDTVSGATQSSEGLLAAVDNALSQAAK